MNRRGAAPFFGQAAGLSRLHGKKKRGAARAGGSATGMSPLRSCLAPIALLENQAIAATNHIARGRKRDNFPRDKSPRKEKSMNPPTSTFSVFHRRPVAVASRV